MAPILSPFAAAAAAAVAMYLLDPDRGRRRRALLRDQAVHVARRGWDIVDAGARDLQHRTWGTARWLVAGLDLRTPSDPVLAERVRAKLGRYVEHPAAIEVTAHEGTVELDGPILRHEHKRLLGAVSSVRGVREVVDRLIVHKTAEGISALQGGKPRRGERLELFQDNWAPGTRVVGTAAGGTLAFLALRTGGVSGALLGAAATVLLLRSTANKPLRQVTGLGGRRGIDVQKTITIHAPVKTVFDFLSNYENFPRFMRNVRSVEPRAHGRFHWVVAGPAGSELQWTSVTTEWIENELLGWRTTEGSPVAHGGIVRFEPFDGGTRVHIRMHYNPPAGALGHVVARLFGADPKTELDEDLMRLKTTVETGHPPRDAAARRSGSGAAHAHA